LKQAGTLYEAILADADVDVAPKRQLGICLNQLGSIPVGMGRFPEAEEVLDKGYTIWVELIRRFPDDARYQTLRVKNRGEVARLRNQAGHHLEAVSLYKQVIADETALVKANAADPHLQHGLAISHVNLCGTLMDCGPPFLPQARSAYEAALPILEGLVKKYPDHPGYRQDLALARYNIGAVFHRLGNHREEEAMLRGALRLYQELADRYPRVADYQHELARTHLGLGLVFRATNRPREAEQHLDRAVSLYRSLAERFSERIAYRAGLAKCELNLGNVLAGAKLLPKVEEAWSHAQSLYEELMRRFDSNEEYRAGVAECRFCLARAYAERGETAKAAQAWRQAAKLYEVLAKQAPRKAYLEGLAGCHYSLARQLDKAGREQEAEPEYRQAAGYLHQLIDKHPKEAKCRSFCAGCHNNLGVILKDRGKSKEAQDEYSKALQVDPDDAIAAGNLVWLLCMPPKVSSEDQKRALELARKIVAQAPANGHHQRLLAMACYRAGDCKAAITAFQKTVQLHEGAEAVDAFFMAMALSELGRQVESRRCYDVGISWLKHHQAQLAKMTVFAEELRRLQAEAAQRLGIQEKKDGR